MEVTEHCSTVVLADTNLESSDLQALFHELKLNDSLKHLSLAASTIDRAAAVSIAEYFRLDNSLRVLDISRSQVIY